MLPHLAGRPPTLVRAPDGVDGRTVLREALPAAPPRRGCASSRSRRRRHAGCIVDDARRRSCGSRTSPRSSCTPTSATRRRPRRTRPRSCSTSIPGPPAGVARLLPRRARPARHCSTRLGLRRGREDVGRQGPAPLGAAARRRRDRRRHEDVRARARPAARERATRTGARSTWRRTSAPGKVFVDWSQNDRHKTTVCAYSLRIAAAADGVDAGHVGRGRATRSTAATPTRSTSRRPTCSSASTSSATSTRRRSPSQQELPDRSRSVLADGPRRARSRSSPARAAASARRPRSRSPSAGARSCARRARPTRRPLPIPGTIDDTVRRITDAGGDGDRGADEPRRRRRGRAHGRDDRRALRPGRHPRQQRGDHVPRRPRPRR